MDNLLLFLFIKFSIAANDDPSRPDSSKSDKSTSFLLFSSKNETTPRQKTFFSNL